MVGGKIQGRPLDRDITRGGAGGRGVPSTDVYTLRPKKRVCFRFADRPYFFGTDPIFFRYFAEKSEKAAPSGISHVFFETTTSKQNHHDYSIRM